MDAWEERYARYTRSELEDALEHIDRTRFPDRARRLEQILASRPIEAAPSSPPPPPLPGPWPVEGAPPPDGRPPASAWRPPRWMRRGFVSVRLTSGLVGLATVFTGLTRIDVEPFGAWVNTAPAASIPDGIDPSRAATLVLGLALIGGGLSHWPRFRRLVELLPWTWGLLSFSVFAPFAVWYPELNRQFWVSFSFEVDAGSTPSSFAVFVLPAFLAVWSQVVADDLGTQARRAART